MELDKKPKTLDQTIREAGHVLIGLAEAAREAFKKFEEVLEEAKKRRKENRESPIIYVLMKKLQSDAAKAEEELHINASSTYLLPEVLYLIESNPREKPVIKDGNYLYYKPDYLK